MGVPKENHPLWDEATINFARDLRGAEVRIKMLEEALSLQKKQRDEIWRSCSHTVVERTEGHYETEYCTVCGKCTHSLY